MWPNTKYLFNGRISTQYEQTAENHLNPIDIILTKNHPLLFTESFIAACGLTSACYRSCYIRFLWLRQNTLKLLDSSVVIKIIC